MLLPDLSRLSLVSIGGVPKAESMLDANIRAALETLLEPLTVEGQDETLQYANGMSVSIKNPQKGTVVKRVLYAIPSAARGKTPDGIKKRRMDDDTGEFSLQCVECVVVPDNAAERRLYLSLHSKGPTYTDDDFRNALRLRALMMDKDNKSDFDGSLLFKAPSQSPYSNVYKKLISVDNPFKKNRSYMINSVVLATRQLLSNTKAGSEADSESEPEF
jgi:hypothetical protein